MRPCSMWGQLGKQTTEFGDQIACSVNPDLAEQSRELLWNQWPGHESPARSSQLEKGMSMRNDDAVNRRTCGCGAYSTRRDVLAFTTVLGIKTAASAGIAPASAEPAHARPKEGGQL